jgi:ABC-type phosphate/phosphonate transport system permease subunit
LRINKLTDVNPYKYPCLPVEFTFSILPSLSSCLVSKTHGHYISPKMLLTRVIATAITLLGVVTAKMLTNPSDLELVLNSALNAPHNMTLTNAERIKRGLSPKAPKRLYNATGTHGKSSFPKI